MTDSFIPQKQHVARSFGNSAEAYDDVAILQRQTGDELIDRLSFVKLDPSFILDLGAGTGRNLQHLQKLYPKAQLLALDIAPEMLYQASQRYQKSGIKKLFSRQHNPFYITADAEVLPLANASVDLVFANLSIQWCDLQQTFTEIARVLKPDGLCLFSTLGPDTLFELREAWASVDDYPHVNVFYDMHDIGEAMMNAGLTEPVLDMDRHVLHYDSVKDVMRDLKNLGARNVNAGRRRSLTGKKALQKVIDYYERFRDNAQIPASYEVIYGQAWASQLQKQIVNAHGEVHVPISEIKRR